MYRPPSESQSRWLSSPSLPSLLRVEAALLSSPLAHISLTPSFSLLIPNQPEEEEEEEEEEKGAPAFKTS